MSNARALSKNVNVSAFSVYPSGAQSVANTTATKIQLGTKEFDTLGHFDITNHRFQPTIAGYYQINGGIGWTNVSALVLASIYKNGSEYKRGTQSGTGSFFGATVSTVVYLNGSTDYVELWGYHSFGSALNTSSGLTVTYMNGIMIAAV